MKWTTDAPTEAGWFIFRKLGVLTLVETYIDKWIKDRLSARWAVSDGEWSDGCDAESLLDGEWLGPIDPARLVRMESENPRYRTVEVWRQSAARELTLIVGGTRVSGPKLLPPMDKVALFTVRTDRLRAALREGD